MGIFSDAKGQLTPQSVVGPGKISNSSELLCMLSLGKYEKDRINQRTNGPVNAHLISWPSKAQNIQNLENIW